MPKHDQTKSANKALSNSDATPSLKNQDRKYSNQDDRTAAINKDRSRKVKER